MGCLKLSYYENNNTLKIAFRAENSTYLRDLDYYPFGMEMPGRSFNPTESNYGFNGKEKVSEISGVDGRDYDFGARMYDTDLGRWMSIDPQASKFPYHSPYIFCADNPIINADIDGEIWKARTKEAKAKTMAMIKLAFGTTEGFYWKGNKLQVDESKFNSAAGILSSDKQDAYDKFVSGIVKNEKVQLKLKVVSGSGAVSRFDSDIPFSEFTDKNKVAKGTIMISRDWMPPLLEDISQKDAEKYAKNPLLKENALTMSENKDVVQAGVIWHEAGHFWNWMQGALYDKDAGITLENNQRTVGFENIFRKILHLPERIGKTHEDPGIQPSK